MSDGQAVPPVSEESTTTPEQATVPAGAETTPEQAVVPEGAVPPLSPRESDEDIHARQQSELDAEREEHNRRTGGGNYPLSTEK